MPPSPEVVGMSGTAASKPGFALVIDQVSAGYADNPIVTDISLSVPFGTITTLIGPNGAGKSTLLRSIYGLTRHFGGRILFRDQPIETLPAVERLRLGIGFVPQGRCNFPLLSVRENLELGAYTARAAEVKRRVAGALDLFPILRSKLAVKAGHLSGGEQQILEMAMVLEAEPELLLLDEPSLGLSPVMQDEVFDIVSGIRARGLTVIIVEQNTDVALEISDTAVVMELGRKFLEGPASEVRTDPRVKTAYLGG